MGSYCSIYFDDMEICSARSLVPEDFCALFQESDRIESPIRSFADRETVGYEIPRQTLLDRLDLLGCTRALAEERLGSRIVAERERWNEWAEEDGCHVQTVDALRSLTLEKWNALVPRVLATRYASPEPEDEVERRMRDDDDDWLWFGSYGSLIGLRSLLEACPNVRTVRLDLTDLVEGGWVGTEERVCENSRTHVLSTQPLAPAMVLAEGASDIRILRDSLSVLFPDRADYFSFFQHQGLRVNGGTDFLVKMIKAFAASRIPLRLVAVFDNDTVGVQAFRHADALDLPPNFALVLLPNIDMAKRYPTIGPTGKQTADVNGRAASIELYLGSAALSVNGTLRPVRWTGFVRSADAYQGTVEDKGAIQDAFLRSIRATPAGSEARGTFPELTMVWETIIDAVVPSAESSQRRWLDSVDATNVVL